ncbi:MAG: ABC transporter substrate-binding protein [Chitinophagales bacterium]
MKKVLAILLAGLLLAAPAGCGKKPANNSQKLDKVTVLLDWTPNTNHTGIYVADQLGYYRKQGIEVKIVQPSSGGAAELVAAGQGDFGFSYQEEVTIARTKGLPIKAIAAVIQHNTSGFASPSGKGIKTPKDFEGRTYGGWGSPAEEAMIKALTSQVKADFSRVKIVNIGTADFFTSVQKDVDFAWIFWGWTGIESEIRGMPLNFIKLRDYNQALDFYSPVLIASEKTINSNPGLVKRFMKATAQGYDYSIKNSDKAAQILTVQVPELNKDLVVTSQKYLAGEYQSDASRWGEMSAERWKLYGDWMYSQGLLEKKLDYKQAFTNKFLP